MTNPPQVWNSEWETISDPELARRQAALLPWALDRLVNRSPFYRMKLEPTGLTSSALIERWHSLPFTEKRELIADQEAFPPFGSNLCVELDELARVHRTSGTSGKPLFLALTRKDIQTVTECGARCFWASGLRPGDLVFHCLNYCLWIGGFTDHQSLETTGAAVVPFGTGNSSALLEAILALKPTAIHCTPSYLARLERLLREEFRKEPADLGLRLGLFGGESGLENLAFRRRIEERWKLRAMNANYGVSDALSMFGAECELRHGLHFMGQGTLLAELVDPGTGSPLPIRQGARGELVLTHLEKEAQPLLRFRTHDLLEVLDHEPCGCGRSGFRFQVLGRSDELIVAKGVNIFPGAVERALEECLDLTTGQFQIVLAQPPPIENLTLRVEVRAGLSPDRFADIRSRIQARLKLKLFISPSVELVPEGSLSTDGKARRVARTYSESPGV